MRLVLGGKQRNVTNSAFVTTEQNFLSLRSPNGDV